MAGWARVGKSDRVLVFLVENGLVHDVIRSGRDMLGVRFRVNCDEYDVW